jgi:hypothetical protein
MFVFVLVFGLLQYIYIYYYYILMFVNYGVPAGDGTSN